MKVLKGPDFEHHPENRDLVIDWAKCGEYEVKLIGDGSKPEKAQWKVHFGLPLLQGGGLNEAATSPFLFRSVAHLHQQQYAVEPDGHRVPEYYGQVLQIDAVDQP